MPDNSDDVFDGIGYRFELHYYECSKSLTTEDLYQAFKARLMHELLVSLPNTEFIGTLKNKPDLEAVQ